MNTELPKWTESIGRENNQRAFLRMLVNQGIGSWLLLYWQTPHGSVVHEVAGDVLRANGVHLNESYVEDTDVLDYVSRCKLEGEGVDSKSIVVPADLQECVEEAMKPIEHQPAPVAQPDPESVWRAYQAGYIKADRARELVDIDHPVYRRLMKTGGRS